MEPQETLEQEERAGLQTGTPAGQSDPLQFIRGWAEGRCLDEKIASVFLITLLRAEQEKLAFIGREIFRAWRAEVLQLMDSRFSEKKIADGEAFHEDIFFAGFAKAIETVASLKDVIKEHIEALSVEHEQANPLDEAFTFGQREETNLVDEAASK